MCQGGCWACSDNGSLASGQCIRELSLVPLPSSNVMAVKAMENRKNRVEESEEKGELVHWKRRENTRAWL